MMGTELAREALTLPRPPIAYIMSELFDLSLGSEQVLDADEEVRNLFCIRVLHDMILTILIG